MIVGWSESYLRTSLTTALATIRASPPNISAHLVEPPPPIVPRPTHAPPASTTQLHSLANRTDQERAAASGTAVSNSNWQNNLPDVRINRISFFLISIHCLIVGMDSYCCSRCEYST